MAGLLFWRMKIRLRMAMAYTRKGIYKLIWLKWKLRATLNMYFKESSIQMLKSTESIKADLPQSKWMNLRKKFFGNR